MTEYHCWVVISYHPHDSDLYLQEECEKHCKHYLTSFPYLSVDSYKIFHYNGLTTFMASALHNHGGDYIIEVFRWLGENAAGSYGLLHFIDDETHNNDGTFRLFTMRKGEVVEQVDNLLSPRVPILEDPYDESRPD